MQRLCKECKEPVSWDAAVCPRCGEQNPVGRDPEVMFLMGLLGITAAGLGGWAIWLATQSLAYANH
jgi:hypothetical protein